MAAIRENVMAALFVLLDNMRAISPTVVATVQRDRPEAVTRDLCPILILHSSAPETLAEETDQHARYTMQVQIEGYAAAATDAAIIPVVHELCARTGVALMADRTLAGVAFDMTINSTEFGLDAEQGHQPLGFFAMTVRVDYQTAPGNPFVAPS